MNLKYALYKRAPIYRVKNLFGRYQDGIVQQVYFPNFHVAVPDTIPFALDVLEKIVNKKIKRFEDDRQNNNKI